MDGAYAPVGRNSGKEQVYDLKNLAKAGYSFAVLGATLTLVAFNRYVVGFGARCFFIALAAAFTGGASGIAEERVINVLIGGVLGIIAVVLSEFVGKRFASSYGRV
jgi:hypothetical protein